MNRRQRLGALIRQARKRRGWSQADLAARSKVGRTTIAAVEGGRKVSASTLDDLASALDWPPGAPEAYLAGDDHAVPLPSEAPLPPVSRKGILEATAEELVHVHALIEQAQGRRAADSWLQAALRLRETPSPKRARQTG